MKLDQLKEFLILQTSNAAEAMKKIDLNARGILFTVDEENKLKGVVTDGDIRRWLIKTGDLEGPLLEIMNHQPKVISRQELRNVQKMMEKELITAVPVVNAKGIVTDIVFRKDTTRIENVKNNSLLHIPVVIMAGGKGTRLFPYTKILPKPLIPIGDIPIMERIINKFHSVGVQNFYTTVNYKKEMIKSYFSEAAKDYNLFYVEEEEPLGTAGSLGLIQDKFCEPFIVTNCDILIHADYEEIYRYHLEKGNELTIVAAMKNILVPYGVVHPKENGTVISMEEKPSLSYFVNTGMYILNPALIDEIPKETFFHMTDLVNMLLVQERKIGMYPISEDSFLDMGEFEEMHRMEQKLNLKAE